MKQYKAIIIDGKKLLRQIFCFFCLLGLLFLFGITKNNLAPEEIVKNVMPVLEVDGTKSVGVGEKLKREFGKALQMLLQFEPGKLETVLAREIPLADTVSQTGVAKLTRETQSPVDLIEPEEILPPAETQTQQPEIPLERQAPIKEVDASPKQKGASKVVLGNETSYEVDPEQLLREKPSINMSGDGPKVLVIHTHGTEAYAPEGSVVYDTEGSDRSENCQENVVKAGEVLCDILRDKGIETLHDKTLHDTPSFNGSYAHALNSIEEYLEKYPSIQVIFDVHRDSIVYQDKTKAKVVTQINGKPAAQLMFVVGTDQKGLENPNWRENIKNAVHLQNAINQRYPTLMRHINVRRERFNGHTTNATMIIETGSSGNSLSEAIYGISLAAECIGDYLNQLL